MCDLPLYSGSFNRKEAVDMSGFGDRENVLTTPQKAMLPRVHGLVPEVASKTDLIFSRKNDAEFDAIVLHFQSKMENGGCLWR
jgi:hypothetical protein